MTDLIGVAVVALMLGVCVLSFISVRQSKERAARESKAQVGSDDSV